MAFGGLIWKNRYHLVIWYCGITKKSGY